MIVVFTEVLILVSHKMQSLFLKFPAPPKGLDETCHLARSYLELLQLKITHSNEQMICWIFSTGLLSLKQQKNQHKISISSWSTSQDKKSQLFLTGL